MKIGILGYGTVASGLVDIIDNNKDKRDISIEGILVRGCASMPTESTLTF